MGVGRHVHRRSRDPGGEVGAVIDVEAAHVVLVGLAFAAVLADDDAGHGLEDLTRSIDRPLLDLLRRDDSYGARLGQAQETVDGLVELRQVPEGTPARHQHVGGQSDAERRLDADTPAFWHFNRAHGRGKGRQPEIHLIAAGRQLPDRDAAPGIRRRGTVECARHRVHADGHAGEDVPVFVSGQALEATEGPGIGDRRGGEENAKNERHRVSLARGTRADDR